MTTFWLLAPIITVAALGLLFCRKAVHAALSLAVVMIGLAILYAAQDAPFLFAVQIIVYTGAIMMLFLFVVMLVGVESELTMAETIRGHRLAAVVVGAGFAILLVLAVGQIALGPVTGLEQANENGNVYGIAELMFGPYVLAFQFTAALLVTAVLGSMVLAHRERLTPALTQADLAAQRMSDYASSGRHPGNAPTPGVFARHNAVDSPALLPDGTPLDESVPPSLVARGQVLRIDASDVEETTRSLEDRDADRFGEGEK